MKKILYCLPAVLVGMVYGLLAALAGGIGGFQVVAWIYLLCPIAAALLLTRGKWWGCLFGIAVAAVMAYIAITTASQSIAVLVIGFIVAVYYGVMGLLCVKSAKK